MNLCEANIGQEYIITEIKTGDEELDAFLFSLGCYSGEKITVVSRRRSGMVIAIKDARYHVDSHLGEAVLV
ncbi:MAG: ferrous iron transport protein A [Clostridia bacterium]|jgi:ferrous iron transport protein A|nr:ferrous iron transport protein A [Clostridia bacterium]